MSREQLQKPLLGALLVVLLIVGWRQFGPRLAPGSGRSESSSSRPVASGAGALGAGSLEVVELRLADLEKVAGQFRPGRDPFRFGESEADQAETSQEQTETSEEEAEEARRKAEELEALRRAMEEQRRQQAAAPPRPILPQLDVQFLGSFGSRQSRLAVFSDGVEIFNVLEGGVLKDHFVIRQIGFESVDVGYVDFPDEPAIRLAAGG